VSSKSKPEVSYHIPADRHHDNPDPILEVEHEVKEEDSPKNNIIVPELRSPQETSASKIDRLQDKKQVAKTTSYVS